MMAFVVLTGLWSYGQTTCYPDAANYNTGSTDGTTFTQTSLIRTQSNNAERGWARFNTAAIPDGDVINSVELHIYVSLDNWAYFRVMSMESDPLSGTASSVFADAGDGTIYAEYAGNFPDPGWYVVDLGAQAATDLKTLLASDWFAVGLYEYEGYGTYFLEYDGWNETNVPYIIVDHAAPAACPDPSNLNASNITQTTADLSWFENGSATLWDIELGAQGFTPTGTPTANDVSSNPYTYTGLTAGTYYDFYVRADCGGDNTDVSNWVGPYTFWTVPNPITSFPWTEDFEHGGALPNFWSNEYVSGSVDWIAVTGGVNSNPATAHSGTYNARFNTSDYNGDQTRFVTPPLDLTGLTSPVLSFWHTQASWGGDQDELRVYYKASASDPWTLIPGQEYTSSITSWTEEAIIALPNPSADYYIAFEGLSGFGYGVCLDDVTVQEAPACPDPSLGIASNVLDTQADLSWTENGTATQWDIELGTAGFTPTGTPTHAGVTNPYTVTGLTGSTDYEWYVRSDCDGSTSNWVGPFAFTTACPAVAAPLTESFDVLYTLPACWSMSGSDVWHFSTGADFGASSAGDHTGNGGQYAWVDGSSPNATDAALYTPLIDVSSLTTPSLTFYLFSNNTDYPGDNCTLYVDFWDGAAWNNLLTFSADNGGWTQNQFDLSGYTITGSVQFRFMVDETTALNPFYNDILIDDVSVMDLPTDAMDWNNLQWPGSATIDVTQNVTIYTQGWEPGVTDAPGQGAGIQVWIGYSTTDTDPSTWTNWVAATYNTDVGNNDEYQADLGAAQGLAPGTYYYASRWQLNGGPYTYGGYNSGGGGFWDGVVNVNGVLTVNPLPGDDCTSPVAIAEVVDYSFSTTSATQSGYNPGCGGTTDPYDIWYEYTATYNGTVTASLCGSSFDTRIALWDGCGGTVLACNDDDCGLQSAITFDVVAGNNYLIQVGGYSGATGSGYLTIAYSNTSWTGAMDNNWDNFGNWTEGVPGPYTDVIIPGGTANDPTLTGPGYCNNLHILSDASANGSLLDNGFLTVSGSVTVDQYLDAQTAGGNDNWHFISPPVSGATADVFHLPGSTGLDVYLQSFDETTNSYSDIIPTTTPLNVMEGYAVWVDGANATPPVNSWVFSYTGGLNTGSFGSVDNLTRTVAGDNGGNNLVGNPYPSSIDWNAPTGWTRTNVQSAIYVEDQGSWGIYDPVNGPTGTGNQGQYIAPGSGFFVLVNDDGSATGTLMMDNNVRVHSSAKVLKSEYSNYLKLKATGNNRQDYAVVHFIEGADPLFNGQEDARKMFAHDESYPQIYTVADKALAANALPFTDMVTMGFVAGTDGSYTIEAVEINDIASVWLEDTQTGAVTDLTESSYTFDYSTGDEAERFILHFAPLAVGENPADLVDIYSFGQNVYVQTPAGMKGTIEVFNVVGQKVASGEISEELNILWISETGYYVVTVTSGDDVITNKVFVR
ncbi:MAG: hypothetical protein Kow00127_22260 [Bacteroidales bacterium]